MRIIGSHYLNDGKGENDGRPVNLIKIEHPSDYDVLLENIVNSNYYDGAYFDGHIYGGGALLKRDTLLQAAIAYLLLPESVLEFGCGRGDFILLLNLLKVGTVRGIEVSRHAIERAWPGLAKKFDIGDILRVSQCYIKKGQKFDTFCAFDIWEHLHPLRLADYVETMVKLSTDDAIFYFIVPAIGEDQVFGEVFPLEFEENRESFNKRELSPHLILEATDPVIPVNGHLIWAHTEWWQQKFECQGLKRVPTLEIPIHHYFGDQLPYALKTFFIFRRDTREAVTRLAAIEKNKLTFLKKWKILLKEYEAIKNFEQELGQRIIEQEDLFGIVNHSKVCMFRELRVRIERRLVPIVGARLAALIAVVIVAVYGERTELRNT